MFMARLLTLFSLFLLVSGCDRSSPQYILHEYSARISQVLDQPKVDLPHDAPVVPSLKARQFVLPDIRLSFLQGLDLLKCPVLSQEVGFRNSSLGKQLQPSQQLDYEKKLINALGQCITSLSKEGNAAATVQTLEKILSKKRQLLPEIRWNALFAGPELVKQLQGNGLPLPMQGDNGYQGTVEALNYLMGYLPDRTVQPPYQREQLETYLQHLHASRYSGQLITAAVMLTNTFNHVSDLLEAEKDICAHGRVTARARRLQNVFNLFYVAQLQPYLVKTVREGNDWRLAFQGVMKVLPEPPSEAMRIYMQNILGEGEGSLWHALNQSILRHSLAWQGVFKQCALLPDVNK
ncbi:DUF3080 family protein [Candidatus Sororendozoicomonas aggregata]|uniref:DUF3080 family protein n=1 Tax=Candidatus Sororendozoicomonas aggregata TaxID=3073239 RepID=UPI002ED0C362